MVLSKQRFHHPIYRCTDGADGPTSIDQRDGIRRFLVFSQSKLKYARQGSPVFSSLDRLIPQSEMLISAVSVDQVSVRFCTHLNESITTSNFAPNRTARGFSAFLLGHFEHRFDSTSPHTDRTPSRLPTRSDRITACPYASVMRHCHFFGRFRPYVSYLSVVKAAADIHPQKYHILGPPVCNSKLIREFSHSPAVSHLRLILGVILFPLDSLSMLLSCSSSRLVSITISCFLCHVSLRMIAGRLKRWS